MTALERRIGQPSEGQQPYGGGRNQPEQRPPEAAHPPPNLASGGEIFPVAAIEAAGRKVRRRVQNALAQRRFQAKLKTNPDSIKQRVDTPEDIQERYKAYHRKWRQSPDGRAYLAEWLRHYRA